MAKYILKESELRSVINNIIAEELSNRLNEGLGHSLGSALKNTLKTAAIGVVAPSYLAQKAMLKTNNLIDGTDSIKGTVRGFFGADDADSSSAASGRDEGMKDLEFEERVGKEYGRPNTTSRMLGNRDKLAPKARFNTEHFGNLGRHYQDIDGVWDKKLEAAERDLAAHSNLGRRLRKQLAGWLEKRDSMYEELAKRY